MTNPARYEKRAQAALRNLSELAASGRGGSVRLLRNVLNGGELSPEMEARLDQQRFATGFHELVNFLPLETGGIRRRPWLRHLGYAASAPRLIPFIFSASQSLVLEFSVEGAGARMRIWDVEGNVATVLEGLPFTERIIKEMSYAQSADVIFLAHEDMRPCKISRYGLRDWRFEEIVWIPDLPRPEWESVEPRGAWPENEWGRVSPEYVVTAVDAETGAESVPSEPYKVPDTFPLSQNWYVVLRPKLIEGVTEYRIYKKSAGVYGFIGRISEPDSETGEWLLEDRNIAPDVEDTPPDNRDPFDGPGRYPALVFLHQQRLGFAASIERPLTFWLSQSGNFESMAASVPPNDDDAIEASLAASQANRILWTVSDRAGLAFGTEGGEWLLVPGEGAALSPKDLSFQPQSSYGSEPGLDAVRAAGSILFAQRGGRVIRDLAYSFQDDRYNATDLSILARHICKDRKIVSMCWQQEPGAILWAVLEDGSLAGLTYLREHEVMAWHRHETAGRFLACCSIPAPDGDWLVHFAIERESPDGGKRISIERFAAEAEPGKGDGPMNSPYVSRAVPTTPDYNGEEGSSFGLVRKIAAVKCQTLNSWPFELRLLSQGNRPIGPLPCPPRQCQAPFTGFWNLPLAAGFAERARVEISTEMPLTLLSMLFSIEFADLQGNQ